MEFGPDDQPAYIESGVYLEIAPPSRLVMSETLENVEAPWAHTTVTVELHDQDGATRVVLTHEGFPSQTVRDLAAGGWPGFLDRIERLVTAD